jgi:hypothetical protein
MANKTFWICPQCGDRKRGGVRPRKNATVRFCLPCSAKTDYLVERSAPVLERKREASRAKSVAKRAAKMEKAKQKWIVAGIDIIAECDRVWRLPSLREFHKGRAKPVVEFQRRHKGNHTSGHAIPTLNRVFLTLPDNQAEVYGVILHELVHCALPPSTAHKPLFWNVLQQATRERWPESKCLIDAHNGWERQAQVDQSIARALELAR